MIREEIEERVLEMFERQGFDVEKEGNRFSAKKNNVSKEIQAFSSEEHSEEDVVSEADAELIFVDQELSDVKESLDSEVSVLEEKEENDYNLPSFEVIGDVAVINELVGVSREEAVKGILECNPNVETILLKTEPLSGEFRVGEYEKLHGEDTETVHTEFGCDFRVDPTKVYYSERFSTERKRVVDQIDDGERVLVMFAGVGPFAILAAEHANPEKVVAIEKNPIAADYLRENIEMNDVGTVVDAYEGDVRDVVPDLDEEFDRVIMPLPERAEEFLDLAVRSCAKSAVIHLYRFGQKGESLPIIPEFDGKFSIRESSVCGEKSASESRICWKILIRK